MNAIVNTLNFTWFIKSMPYPREQSLTKLDICKILPNMSVCVLCILFNVRNMLDIYRLSAIFSCYKEKNYISIKPTGCPELCTISTARLWNFVIFYVTSGSFRCIEMNNWNPSADFITFPIAVLISESKNTEMHCLSNHWVTSLSQDYLKGPVSTLYKI
jgi:hypothetical protein